MLDEYRQKPVFPDYQQVIYAGTASPEFTEHFPLAVGSIVSRTACLGAELHLRLLVRPRGKVVVLAQEVVIVCLCLKDTEIHATSKQGNTTNSALESLHSLQRDVGSYVRCAVLPMHICYI